MDILLPMEIMEMVGGACDDKTWGRLRRTCGTMNAILEPQRQQRWFQYLVREGERVRRCRTPLRGAIYIDEAPLFRDMGDIFKPVSLKKLTSIQAGTTLIVHHIWIFDVVGMHDEFILAIGVFDTLYSESKPKYLDQLVYFKPAAVTQVYK